MESAKSAHKIVEQFTSNFFAWLQTLSVEPVIKHIRYLAKESALKELDRAIKKGFLPQEYRQSVLHFYALVPLLANHLHKKSAPSHHL